MASIINAATSGGLVTSADTSGVLQLQTASTTAVTVDASQNVGVGMTPVYKLDVTGGNGNAIRFTDSVNSVQVAMGAFNSQGFFGTLSNHPQLFYVNSGEGMRLTSTGLGIGTSSPVNKLQVAGAVAATGGAGGYAANMALLDVSGGNAQITAIGANTSTVGTLVFQAFSSNASLGGERARIDSSGNMGIGTTSPSDYFSTASKFVIANTSGDVGMTIATSSTGTGNIFWADATSGTGEYSGYIQYAHNGDSMRFGTNGAERARIDSSGNFLVGTTDSNPGGADINGIALRPGNFSSISALGATPLGINRGTDDGTLISFAQAGNTEGSISVSGTTVSYNGGHLSRYAQTTTAKDESLVKGTVLSNLDEMNVYTKDGQPVDNEQLNKVKVSDTEGDVNVAGVFVNWSHDEQHNVDEINMAMTGDMIIRIAQGVTVVRGDLLMSAGDGTAKPQGDDIIRSKTVAKVTSNHVTCTYADGSYCVPCVLMAC